MADSVFGMVLNRLRAPEHADIGDYRLYYNETTASGETPKSYENWHMDNKTPAPAAAPHPAAPNPDAPNHTPEETAALVQAAYHRAGITGK